MTVAVMEPTQQKLPGYNGTLSAKELDEVLSRLAEIDQKIEHIIESIHESLYTNRENPPQRPERLR